MTTLRFRAKALRRLLVLWLWLGCTCQPSFAEPQQEIDETFNFSVTRNIPYVPAKLDQAVNKLQILDIYRPVGAESSPVILYIHGGGWAFGDKKDVHYKPHYFTRNGFAFVSMNYRLHWDYKVYDELVDIISAIAWINQEGASHGLDSSRVVLMGHAAGAHLSSLVVGDPSYLLAENMTAENIKAVIAIDSSSYDILRLMKELGSFVERRQHELIFGGDQNVWKAASPIHHVMKGKSLPPFAIIYDLSLDASTLQAKGFAKRLAEADVPVIMIPGLEDSKTRTNELIGTAGNVTTGALMAFLRSQI